MSNDKAFRRESAAAFPTFANSAGAFPWTSRRCLAVFLIHLLLFSVCQNGIFAQDLMCCSHAAGTCRSVCETISLVQLAADSNLRNKTVQEVRKFCPAKMSSFWECLNATFKDMSRGESWSGRVCCPIPQSESCRRACITATSHFDLAQGCRRSDEIAFFSCLDHQKDGELCCGNALDEDCKNSCFDIFKSQLTPTKLQRQRVKEHCEGSNPKVFDCVKDFIKVTPAKNSHKHMHCCDMSNKSKCRESCKKVLSSEKTFQEILDGLLLGGCGNPMLDNYFWQCFMKPAETEPVSTSVEVSRIGRVGIDSAKWHCCQKASNPQCQRLCGKIFTTLWSTLWDEFHMKCLSQIGEENLRNCIDEVEEPCELGCDGLSFCTNFNNRPTELFRSCTSQADVAARNDVTQWLVDNKLTLPGLPLPLKNISECSPNVWKAVACTLQIKPCSRHSHANQICRDDCMDILTQCVDWSRVPPNHSPDTICSGLSPEDPDESCIRLQNFLHPSESNYQRITEQVSSPCKGEPCEPHEICLPNKNCVHGSSCKPYTCTPGCKLGEVSEYMVPDGSYVQIPRPKHAKGNLQICKCNSGKLEECQPLLFISLTPCLLGSSHQAHGTSFNQDCNSCSCYAGEVVCSRKQCESSALSGRNTAYTTLPCNCSPHYVPVCGRNGNTYPSACLAKCAELSDSDMEHMPCDDPCKGNKCPIGQKCVSDPKICLSLKHKPCKQFECVNGTTNCRNLPKDPVCDVDNIEHDNSCMLAHHNSRLAYRGPCLRNCNFKSRVCGINGHTYASECAAWADMVAVDYPGPCMAIGLITDMKVKQCPHIACPPLPDPNCLGITPPGACCPVCGGAVRLLYSRHQINRALFVLQNKDTQSLTLRALLKALERQIQVAQCVLRGYLTVEQDIFVVVQTTEQYPSELQLEACVREAEKIASLVNIQSPRIVSEVSLCPLISADVVHTQVSSGATRKFNLVSALVGVLFLKFLL